MTHMQALATRPSSTPNVPPERLRSAGVNVMLAHWYCTIRPRLRQFTLLDKLRITEVQDALASAPA